EFDAGRYAKGVARARAARSLTVETASRDPRLLRRRCLQRPRRGHQRPPRAPARDRPGLPQPQALHLAVTHSLRPASGSDQCTLIPEEPLILAMGTPS